MSVAHTCPIEPARDPRPKRGYTGSSERPCHVTHLPPRPPAPPVAVRLDPRPRPLRPRSLLGADPRHPVLRRPPSYVRSSQPQSPDDGFRIAACATSGVTIQHERLEPDARSCLEPI